MSGGDYVQNFGNRMKSYPRRASRKPQQRKPAWFRIKSKASFRWVYFFYEGRMADFPDFARGIVGSFQRRSEPLGSQKPAELNEFPFAQHRGVDLFLEKL